LDALRVGCTGNASIPSLKFHGVTACRSVFGIKFLTWMSPAIFLLPAIIVYNVALVGMPPQLLCKLKRPFIDFGCFLSTIRKGRKSDVNSYNSFSSLYTLWTESRLTRCRLVSFAGSCCSSATGGIEKLLQSIIADPICRHEVVHSILRICERTQRRKVDGLNYHSRP